MNSPRLAFASLMLSMAIVSCRSPADSTPPGEAQLALVLDQAHNGGATGFYFLPPVVSQPQVAGTFVATFAPTVSIDELDAHGIVLRTIVTYSTTGPGSERVRVDTASQNYVVNWNTGKFSLSTSLTYRIRVSLGPSRRELGFADAQIVAKGGKSKSGLIAVEAGSTLPVKFWLGGCAAVTCTPSDMCHTVGTCDPVTIQCSNPAAPNGASCDDGDACTRVDTCSEGTCVGSSAVVCDAPDQCHQAGTCDRSTGACTSPWRPDGTRCHDACGLGGTCRSGTCTVVDVASCRSIDSAGGMVEIPNVASLLIPPGALASPTSIMLRQVPLPDASTSGVRFTTKAVEIQPEGVFFQSPLELTLAYNEASVSRGDASRQVIYQILDNGLSPSSETTADQAAHTLSVPLRHFSSYVGALPPLGQSSCRASFKDGFEQASGWGMFEEVVGQNVNCYTKGIGEVAPSTNVGARSSSSLRVWANQAGSKYSDHVIGQKKLYRTGVVGTWTYSVKAFIAPTTAESGEAGPEFSMQNTRLQPVGATSSYLTATAGIQYRPSPYASPLGNWAVWSEIAPGQAGWQQFTVRPLQPGQWYTLTLTADYHSPDPSAPDAGLPDVYRSLQIDGPGGSQWVDLSAYVIARENKGFDEEAFWLTLESENLYNKCRADRPASTQNILPTQNVVYYDDVYATSYAAQPTPLVFDLSSDERNCGQCGLACAAGQECVQGQCVCNAASCPSGCCDVDGQCRVPSAESCGFSGGACSVCPRGLSCDGAGQCACLSASCPGVHPLIPEGTHVYDLAVDATNVYWTTGGWRYGVMRAPIEGGPATVLAPLRDAAGNLCNTWGVAVDQAYVYWSDYCYPNDAYSSLRKVPLQGGPVTTLIRDYVMNEQSDIAVDAAGVYWFQQLTGVNYGPTRVPLEGGLPTPLASSGGGGGDIAVNATSLYWTSYLGQVSMAPIGGGPTQSITSQESTWGGIALDSTSVYWVDRDAGAIMKAPLAGGTPTTFVTGQNQPYSIAVTPTSVFWTNRGDGTDGTVMQAPVTGGSPTTIATGQSFDLGVVRASAMAADATSVYWGANSNVMRWTSSCPAIPCPPGQVQDPTTCTCTCPSACPAGQVHDATCACQCPACPAGQLLDAGTCACTCPSHCPTGQAPDPTTCGCACPSHCPGNSFQDPVTCGCSCLPCQPDQVQDATTCACTCLPGQFPSASGLTCCPNACPDGMTIDDTCQCQPILIF